LSRECIDSEITKIFEQINPIINRYLGDLCSFMGDSKTQEPHYVSAECEVK